MDKIINLPVGRQVFEDIRTENLLYVDKTQYIYELIAGSGIKQFFMSRPRRFGKTLLCWTLDAVFSGRKELFEGLVIEKSDWNWEKHPVIRLDMSAGSFSKGVTAAEKSIKAILRKNAKKLGIKLHTKDELPNQFQRLIEESVEKYGQKAVVIVDEYDNPLLSVIENEKEFKKVREMLRDFYKIIKAEENNLRFAFLTGVTKFSKVSVFSALNNLTDITLDQHFSGICGITQEELEQDFTDYIDKYAVNYNGRENYLEELKDFYNGYRFSKSELTVYNPFGLLNHFNSGEFNAYWFESGTPNFLINLLNNQKVDILTLKNKKVTEDNFRKYDLENMAAIPMLYQAGYLTVSDYNNESKNYTLDYPNTEVRSAFSDELAVKYLKVSGETKDSFIANISEYLFSGDVNSVIELAIKPFMAEIPNNLAIRHEQYFQTIFHIIFNMLGLKCRSEVSTATGRIDSIVETPKYVYCFEFKLNKNAEEALAQIDTKEYLTPYVGTGKTLFKIGVNFNYDERKIEKWLYEKVE